MSLTELIEHQRTGDFVGNKITTRQAAEMLGVSMARVLTMAKQGRLGAEKKDTTWLYDEEEVMFYKMTRAVGRPRKER